VSGNYSFHIACDGECELWFDENGIKSKQSNEMENNLKKIVHLDNDHLVNHNEWNRRVSCMVKYYL